MRLSPLDRSRYYRGLLVLVRKDRLVDRRERSLMLQIGRLLDFDPSFCAAALDDLLRNRAITDEPVVFSRREIAECFLADAAALACCDGEVHPHEMACLRSVARANGITTAWLHAQVQSHVAKSKRHELPPFPAVGALI
jgi:hypothetical protein